jgi:hypothetical protein
MLLSRLRFWSNRFSLDAGAPPKRSDARLCACWTVAPSRQIPGLISKLWISVLCVANGSLSRPTGLVAVGWEIDGDSLSVRRTEAGGPRITTPGKKGLDSTLLERTIVQSNGTIGSRKGCQCRPSFRSAVCKPELTVATYAVPPASNNRQHTRGPRLVGL